MYNRCQVHISSIAGYSVSTFYLDLLFSTLVTEFRLLTVSLNLSKLMPLPLWYGLHLLVGTLKMAQNRRSVKTPFSQKKFMKKQRKCKRKFTSEVDFTRHPDAIPESIKDNLLRFQQNPTRNWGPLGRAK